MMKSTATTTKETARVRKLAAKVVCIYEQASFHKRYNGRNSLREARVTALINS